MQQEINSFDPKIRQTYIGGTDAAAILGLSKWRTPYELYLEKTRKIDDEFEPSEQTNIQRWGHLLEPLIAQEYINKYGGQIVAENEFMRDHEHSFIAANVDRKFVTAEGELAILECKSVASTAFVNWKLGVPIDYYTQGQWYLGVTGFDTLIFAIFVLDSREIHQFVIHRDDAYIDGIRESVVDFWNNHIEPRVEPELTAADWGLKPSVPEKCVTADAEDIELHQRLKNIKAQIKSLEIEESELQLLIQGRLEDSESMLTADGGRLFTWKSQTANRIDTTLLRDKHPEIAKEVTKQSTSRKFLIK